MELQPADNQPRAAKETLSIPDSVRAIIDERDGRHCRVCGRYLGDARAIHHIIFGGDARGAGGRRVHDPDEMVTVCWMYPGNCHDLVHSQKKKWQGVLLDVVQRHKGITAMQLMRWHGARLNRPATGPTA